MADEKKISLNFDNCQEAEEAFVDDDDQTEMLDDIKFEENQWPKDNPSNFSFKGKNRIFLKAVEHFKILMKKGSEKMIGNVTFKVLDSKKIPFGIEYEV